MCRGWIRPPCPPPRTPELGGGSDPTTKRCLPRIRLRGALRRRRRRRRGQQRNEVRSPPVAEKARPPRIRVRRRKEEEVGSEKEGIRLPRLPPRYSKLNNGVAAARHH
ncbi:hypothetical protein BS78_K225400 [Paspalum vaginatum]|uniref:Uncharacterized protein n=1 Tax=Paspalum vaginatum TaxID=158149 RepID=A0A9W7X8S9_9POAL|nr:hypothetical protein BS78_K225400 [Paspalum vaginatum]